MSQKQQKLKVIIHVFGLSRGLNSEPHRLPPRGIIGHLKESCGLERICGCLYVHFDTFLGFTRNEQMGCLETFRDNANDANHLWINVTSHIDFPRNVSGENMTMPGETQKCPKNSQNWRLIYTLSYIPGVWAPNATWCLLWTWEVIGKESCGLERICGCLYVHFETILGFTRNEQNKVFTGFSRQHKWCQAPAQRYKSRRIS